MSIRIVFDHPRAHSGRRLLLAARAVAGAPLVCVGLVASIVALPATFGVRGLVFFVRRFGYDEATLVTTFAAARTIGTAWRL